MSCSDKIAAPILTKRTRLALGKRRTADQICFVQVLPLFSRAVCRLLFFGSGYLRRKAIPKKSFSLLKLFWVPILKSGFAAAFVTSPLDSLGEKGLAS
jgi:hypothetical protein